MDKKLTDNEIIKALECCANCESCDYETTDCPLGKEMECRSILAEYALDLYNRLQTDNEDIKFLYENLKEEHLEIIKAIKHTKAEAYKEFAERLKKEKFKINYCGSAYNVVDEDDIDNLLKELVNNNEKS